METLSSTEPVVSGVHPKQNLMNLLGTHYPGAKEACSEILQRPPYNQSETLTLDQRARISFEAIQTAERNEKKNVEETRKGISLSRESFLAAVNSTFPRGTVAEACDVILKMGPFEERLTEMQRAEVLIVALRNVFPGMFTSIVENDDPIENGR